MARSQKPQRRNAKSVAPLNGSSGIAPDIYALVLHGIGVRDAETVAKNAIRNVVSYLEDGERWTLEECGPDCAFSPGHAHLSAAGPTKTRLVVDPYFWGTEVPSRNILVVLWWALRAVFALGILQIATPVMRFVGFSERASERPGLSGALSLLYALALLTLGPFVLFFRIAILLCGAVVALTLVLVLPPLWKYARDAFAWCSNTDFEDSVIRSCGQRVAASRAKKILLLGHSQGGAILTEFVLSQPARFQNMTRLVTFGSGQALLATLRQGRTVRIWTTLSVFFCAVAYVMAAVALLAPPLFDLLGVAGEGMRQFGVVASALWLAPIVDPTAVAATPRELASTNLQGAFTAMTRESPQLPGWAFLTLPLLNAAMFVSAKYIVLPLGRLIESRTRPPVGGADIVASRDHIATPLRALGAASRVVVVHQASSSLLDHVVYYRNGITALPSVASALDQLRGLGETPLEARALRRSDHEHALRTRGTRAAGLVSAIVLGLLISSYLEAMVAPIIVVGIAALVGLAVAEQGSLKRLDEDSSLARRGYLHEAHRRRWRRRSLFTAGLLIVSGVFCLGVLVGVAQPVLSKWVSPSTVERVREQTGLVALAMVLLFLAAWLYLRGSRFSGSVGLAAAAAFSGLFLAFGWSSETWVAGALLLLVGVIFVWRWRTSKGIASRDVS